MIWCVCVCVCVTHDRARVNEKKSFVQITNNKTCKIEFIRPECYFNNYMVKRNYGSDNK